MLKYTDIKVVFREIPDEISLAINISGCPCACEGCHSSYLLEDRGEPLVDEVVERFVEEFDAISCLLFMGGDGDPKELSRLAGIVKEIAPKMKIGWYSGRDELSKQINLSNFDYIKIGSYQKDRGPLDSPTTNQRLYRVDCGGELLDITLRLQRGK